MIYYELEVPDQVENEDDLNGLDVGDVNDFIISNTDWTIETIKLQVEKGNIQLNPSFQRRDAWTKQRKSKFIESLFLGIPVPPLVLAESPASKGKFIVLDGKQRLLSIMQFMSAAGGDFNQLKLTKLEIRKDLSGKPLENIEAEGTDISFFENQSVRTTVIKNCRNENFLYHIFLRLNTGSLPLSPQELRQALHPGQFSNFLDEATSNSKCLKDVFHSDKPDFRMRDIELLLRYIAMRTRIKSYRGNLKLFLDDTLKAVETNWDLNENDIKNTAAELEKAHIAALEIFGNNIYRRWNNGSYEGRFNRSVFEIIVLSLSDDKNRGIILLNKERTEDLFKEICENNQAFVNSIVQTTKSIGALSTRITEWNRILNKNIGTSLSELEIDNTGIAIN